MANPWPWRECLHTERVLMAQRSVSAWRPGQTVRATFAFQSTLSHERERQRSKPARFSPSHSSESEAASSLDYSRRPRHMGGNSARRCAARSPEVPRVVTNGNSSPPARADYRPLVQKQIVAMQCDLTTTRRRSHSAESGWPSTVILVST